MNEGFIYEGDDWVDGEPTITSQDALRKVAAALKQTVLIIEHRHYRASSAPTRLFFEDYDKFLAYLNQNAQPGDSFWTWPFDSVCTESNAIVVGKYPDKRGRTPRKGAY